MFRIIPIHRHEGQQKYRHFRRNHGNGASDSASPGGDPSVGFVVVNIPIVYILNSYDEQVYAH